MNVDAIKVGDMPEACAAVQRIGEAWEAAIKTNIALTILVFALPNGAVRVRGTATRAQQMAMLSQCLASYATENADDEATRMAP